MKNECDIVKDVMPLCIDDLASEATKDFVNEHIESCEECREEWNTLNKDLQIEQIGKSETTPLKKVKRIIRFKALKAAAITLLSVLIVFVTFYYHGYEVLHYCSYSDSGIQIEVDGDTLRYYTDQNGSFLGASYTDDEKAVYVISCCYTWFYKMIDYDSHEFDQYQTIDISDGRVVTVYFYNPDTNENVLLYHNTDEILENQEVAEYSANNITSEVIAEYYLKYVLPSVLAIALLLVLIKIPFKNKPLFKSVTVYALFVPIAYLISLILIAGIMPLPSIASYEALEELETIIELTVLIFAVEVLIRSMITIPKPQKSGKRRTQFA